MFKFWIRCVYVTAFVFFMLWVVSIITDLKLFNAFDPVSQALGEFELTDYAFSNLRPDPTVDQRIVLVNIGHISRREIANQINIIRQFKPRVIGVDGFFNCEGGLRDSINCPQLLDTLGNLLLTDAIREAGNVVLVTKLLQKTATGNDPNKIDFYDSIEYSDPAPYAHNAFANFPTDADYQEDVKLCRTFIPRLEVNGKYENSFAVEIARMYDSTKTRKLFDRGNDEEIVNYKGNVELTNIKLKSLQSKNIGTTNFKIMFYALDIDQVVNGEFAPDLLRDKIVIMGYLGNYFGDPAWEDKYFTPLNRKVAGRANPDMFGVVVHANIVAMILNGDYVGQLSDWSKYAIAALICVLTVALFIVIDEKLPIWYDALSVIIQVLQILLISGLVVYGFATFTFKLDLTIVMAVCALVGPCYDLLKPLQNVYEKWLTRRRERVLTSQN
ncbi:MAG TPA: CHASE2 domain-containing protein [Cyclobacteriaceae bacterium]|nr:CHASE2 domain-containing protein [Cyclobacteriaceae bacterium]